MLAPNRFEGRRPDPPPQAQSLLPVEASCQFHYFHHPIQWDVVGMGEEAIIIPRLRLFRLEPGLSGVVQVPGRNDGNANIAFGEIKQAGWIELPRMPVKAWGSDQPDYCIRYDGVRGPVHAEAWRRFHIVGAQVATEWDQEGWIKFLQSLPGKYIPEISPSIQRALFLDFQGAAEKRLSNDKSVGAQRRGTIYEARLSVLEGGRSPVRQEQEPAPEPAPVAPSQFDQVMALLQGLSAQNASLSARLDEQGSALAAIQSRGKPGPKPPVAPPEEKAV